MVLRRALLFCNLGTALAGVLRVMLIQNTAQNGAGWKEGVDFLVPYLNDELGGFNITGDANSPYKVEVVMCPVDLRTDAKTKLEKCVAAAGRGENLLGTKVGPVDAIFMASSSSNAIVQAAAEALKIPNLHCSGGNPAMWTARTPHAFGLHMPFPWYSRGAIRQAGLVGVKSVVVIRDHDWGFPRISAVAAMEWSQEAKFKIIGPTLAWCQKWSNFTTTCRVVGDACRCGTQEEYDKLGYKYQADTMPSMYELSEKLVAEPGFAVRSEFISPAIVDYVKAIIDDVRSQGADPDMVVNWMAAARSGLMAMLQERLSFSAYFGGPNYPGTGWNGYESYFANGSRALGKEHAMYNVGGAQWHHDMFFSDPFFGSSAEMVKMYSAKHGGKPPTYDGAACMGAGVALTYGLQKYGDPLDASDVAARREQIRVTLGSINDETVFGNIRFNRFNQNVGRMTINWQVMEDGSTKPVLPAEAAATPYRYPTPSWDARLGCPPGTYASGPLPNPTECKPCGEGTSRGNVSLGLEFSQCFPCAEGTGTLPGVLGSISCDSCPPGRAQDGLGDNGVCNACGLGTARGVNSSTGASCDLCPAGRYASVRGLADCDACPERSSQPDRGQTSCICDVGAYKDSSDQVAIGVTKACLPCENDLKGGSTLYPGSKSNASCICPEGKYWFRSAPNKEPSCKVCGEGLICLGGFAGMESGTGFGDTETHQPPLQEAGYSAGPQPFPGAEPTWLVKCDSSKRCPASLPVGSCPDLASGRACAACSENAFDDGVECTLCENTGEVVGLVLGLIVAALVMLTFVFLFATKKSSPHRDTVMTATITGTLCVATVQSVAAFSKVNVVWVEPLKSMNNIMQLLTFNIAILRPGCWIGPMDPVQFYLGSLLMYPVAVLFIFALCAISKYVLKRDVTKNQVINAQGMLITAAYIALTFLAALPYQCQRNPDGSSSLLSYYSMACWEVTEHIVMVLLSVPLFLTILAFMAMVLWATVKYPISVAMPGGINFVKRFNFLFAQFKPEAYFFATIMSTRNFLVGLIPVALTGATEIQFLSLALVISTYTILQARFWPWRTNIANYLDSCLAVILIVILIVGSMLVDRGGGKSSSSADLQIVMFVALIIAFLSIVGMLVKSVYPIFWPSRTYGIFLSHHKSAAAVLSRWCKMLLSESTTDRIFLDSDDVNKLDAIIDTTAFDSKNVVVLLTSETLERMWCAAELASAHRAGTNVVLVSCDGSGFSDSLIERVPGLWTEEQQATLANSGVTIPDIVAAYKSLAKEKLIQLPRKGASLKEHERAMKEVMERCGGLGKKFLNRISQAPTDVERPSDGKGPGIRMLGDIDTPESGCCCRVIQALLQAKLQEGIKLLEPEHELPNITELPEKFGSSSAILVILTQGMLERASFAAMLVCVPEEVRSNMVPIKADENFVYPNPAFWDELLAGRIVDESALKKISLGMITLEMVRAAYAKLFNVLALKFSSHGSEAIQGTEIEVMAGRLAPMINPNIQAKPSKSFSSPLQLRRELL